MMDKKILESSFSEFFRDLKFRKKRTTWYLHINDVTMIFNLQKSSYGDQFYLNFGCVPDGIEVEGMPMPPDYMAPIYVRLTEALPTSKEEIECILDLENKLDDSERILRLKLLLSEKISAFISGNDSIEKIKLSILNGFFDGGFVLPIAKRKLGI